MTSPLRRLVLSLAVLAMTASACSSGNDLPDNVEVADDGALVVTEPTAVSPPAPAAESATDGAESDAEPVPAEATEQLAPGDPSEITTDFLRSQFNIDPTPEWVACIIDQGSSDSVLEQALTQARIVGGGANDAQLKSLSYAMNGCVDTISLADWTTQAIGPQGDVADTAPACFAEKYNDPELGDAVFYNFVALTRQFRLDAATTPDLVQAMTECAPIEGLTEFFASSEEQASGLTIFIDRDCLNEAISDPSVSEEFWQTFVDGGTPPAAVMQPYLDGCNAEDPDADLASLVPEGFEPWAGTGMLAEVNPPSRANVYDAPPPLTIDTAKNYQAVIETGGGTVVIELFTDTAPVTVNNFVNLARDGYYDGTIFHRVLADFMAQGGDPTGTGTGGPGYAFEDEVDNDRAFDRPGILAMANSGPATNGSQFFITTVPTDWLNGKHTIFGEVVEGYNLIAGIELRDPNAPAGPGQRLDSVTIIES